MKLGEKLSFLRKKHGMTQLELAEKLDVSRQAVSRWEADKAKPTLDNLQSLSKLYGVQIDCLFNVTEEPVGTSVSTEPRVRQLPKPSFRMRGKVWIIFFGIVFTAFLVIACYGYLHPGGENSNYSELKDAYREETEGQEISEFDLEWE